MISGEEIKNLAGLARIEVSAEEVIKLQRDLGAILDYVGELKSAPANREIGLGPDTNFNRLREDGEPELSIESTGFVKVKKIL